MEDPERNFRAMESLGIDVSQLFRTEGCNRLPQATVIAMHLRTVAADLVKAVPRSNMIPALVLIALLQQAWNRMAITVFDRDPALSEHILGTRVDAKLATPRPAPDPEPSPGSVQEPVAPASVDSPPPPEPAT